MKILFEKYKAVQASEISIEIGGTNSQLSTDGYITMDSVRVKLSRALLCMFFSNPDRFLEMVDDAPAGEFEKLALSGMPADIACRVIPIWEVYRAGTCSIIRSGKTAWTLVSEKFTIVYDFIRGTTIVANDTMSSHNFPESECMALLLSPTAKTVFENIAPVEVDDAKVFINNIAPSIPRILIADKSDKLVAVGDHLTSITTAVVLDEKGDFTDAFIGNNFVHFGNMAAAFDIVAGGGVGAEALQPVEALQQVATLQPAEALQQVALQQVAAQQPAEALQQVALQQVAAQQPAAQQPAEALASVPVEPAMQQPIMATNTSNTVNASTVNTPPAYKSKPVDIKVGDPIIVKAPVPSDIDMQEFTKLGVSAGVRSEVIKYIKTPESYSDLKKKMLESGPCTFADLELKILEALGLVKETQPVISVGESNTPSQDDNGYDIQNPWISNTSWGDIPSNVNGTESLDSLPKFDMSSNPGWSK